MGDNKSIHSQAWEDELMASSRKPSFQVSDLAKDDIIVVETDRHRYEFRVIDPAALEVMITSDDPLLPGPSEGNIQGSAIVEGSTMRGGGIIIEGYHLVVGCPDLPQAFPVTELAKTRRVSVNGIPVIPKPDRCN